MIYKSLVKPLLFSMDAETAHHWGVNALRALDALPGARAVVEKICAAQDPVLQSRHFGRTFKSPVGLGAGFDKNCDLSSILPAFGFGFIECGTVTALAQPGNPKPRIFRLPEYQGLINRLGFNNCGAEQAAQNLQRARRTNGVVLGLNIGKSKVTELEKATQDYLLSFQALWPFADYMTVNVSSPNTPGLRLLQNNLEPLLQALQDKNKQLGAAANGQAKPLFVKIAPDLHQADLEQIVDQALRCEVQGLIISNTTIGREGVQLKQPIEGGLSGRPLFQKSTDVLRAAYKQSAGRLTLIGVGGIFSAQDAYEKIRSGASLVQVYTGWIYNGPGFIKCLNKGLAELLKRDGFQSVQQAVGSKNI